MDNLSNFSLAPFLISELAHEGTLGVPLFHFLYILTQSPPIINLVSENLKSNEQERIKSNNNNNIKTNIQPPIAIDTITNQTLDSENNLTPENINNSPLDPFSTQDANYFLKFLLLLLWDLKCIEWFYWKPQMKMIKSDIQVWMATPDGIGISSFLNQNESENAIEDDGELSSKKNKKSKSKVAAYYNSLEESGLVVKISNPKHKQLSSIHSQNLIDESINNIEANIKLDENNNIHTDLLDEVISEFNKYKLQYGNQLNPNIFQNMFVIGANSYFTENVLWIRLNNDFQYKIKESMNLFSQDACINDNQKVILEMAMRSRNNGFSQYLLSQILKTDSKSLSYSVGKLEELGLIVSQQEYSQLTKRELKNIYLPIFSKIIEQNNNITNHNVILTEEETSFQDEDYSEMSLQTLKGWNQFQKLRKNCVVIVTQILKSLKNNRCTAKFLKTKFGFRTTEERERIVSRRRWDNILLKLRSSHKFNIYRAKIIMDKKMEIRQIIELIVENDSNNENNSVSQLSEDEDSSVNSLDFPLSLQVFKAILNSGPNGINSTEISEMFNLESKQALLILSELSRRFPISSSQVSQGSYSNYRFTTTSTNTSLFKLSELVGTTALYFISSKTKVRTPISETNAERILWTLDLLEEKKAIALSDVFWLLVNKAKVKNPDRRTAKRIMMFCNYHKLGVLFVRFHGIDEGKIEYLVHNDISQNEEEANRLINHLSSNSRFSNQFANLRELNEEDFQENIEETTRHRNSVESKRLKLFYSIKYGYILSPFQRLKEFYFLLLEKCEEILMLNRLNCESAFDVELDFIKDVLKSMSIRNAAKLVGIVCPNENYVNRLFDEEVTIAQYQLMQNQPQIFLGQGVMSKFLSSIVPLCKDLQTLKIIDIIENEDGTPKLIKLQNYCILHLPIIWKRPRRFHFGNKKEKVISFWKILPLYIQNEVDACKDLGADENDTFASNNPTFSKENREEVTKLRKSQIKVLYYAYTMNPNPSFSEMVSLHEKNPNVSIEIIFLYFMRHKTEFDKINPLQLSIKSLTSKPLIKKSSKKRDKTEMRQRVAWTDEEDMNLLVALGLWILTRKTNRIPRVSWTEIAQIANENDNVRCSRRYGNYLSSLPWVKAGVHSLQRWKKPNINCTSEEIEELKNSIRTMFEHFKNGHAASMPPHIASNFTHPISSEEFYDLYEFASHEIEISNLYSNFGPVESSLTHYIKGVLRTPSLEYNPAATIERISSLGLEEILEEVNSKLITDDIIVKRQKDEFDKRGYHFSQYVQAIERLGRQSLYESANQFRNLFLDSNSLIHYCQDYQEDELDLNEERKRGYINISAVKIGKSGKLLIDVATSSAGENFALLNLMMNNVIRLIPLTPNEPYEKSNIVEIDTGLSQNENIEENVSGVQLLRGHGIIIQHSEANVSLLHTFRGYNVKEFPLMLEYISEPETLKREGRRFLSDIPTIKLQEILTNSNSFSSKEINYENIDNRINSNIDEIENNKRKSENIIEIEKESKRIRVNEIEHIEYNHEPNIFQLLDELSIYVKDIELKPFLNYILKRFKYANAEEEIYLIMELYEIVNEGKSEGKSKEELLERCNYAFTNYITDFENFYLIRRVFGLNEIRFIGMRYSKVHTVVPWEIIETDLNNNNLLYQSNEQNTLDSIQAKENTFNNVTHLEKSNPKINNSIKSTKTPNESKDVAQEKLNQKIIKTNLQVPPLTSEPWIKANGQFNYEFIGNIKRSIIEKISDNPGISEKSIISFLRKILGNTLALEIIDEMMKEGLIYYNEHIVEVNVGLFGCTKSKEKFFFASTKAYFN